MFNPEWKKYEKDMHSSDPDVAIKATDAFIAEREHQLQVDTQAKRWEESRKEAAVKDKAGYVKARVAKEEHEKYQQTVKPMKDLLVGGSFDCTVKPSPGYVLVEIEKVETTTSSGIVLVAGDKMENIGLVLEISDPIPCTHCFTHPAVQPQVCPAKQGDRVVFKKGAGMEFSVKGKDCRFMAFSDLLATLYD
jgi:co-chaperonin GroES (HSP10)